MLLLSPSLSLQPASESSPQSSVAKLAPYEPSASHHHCPLPAPMDLPGQTVLLFFAHDVSFACNQRVRLSCHTHQASPRPEPQSLSVVGLVNDAVLVPVLGR